MGLPRPFKVEKQIKKRKSVRFQELCISEIGCEKRVVDEIHALRTKLKPTPQPKHTTIRAADITPNATFQRVDPWVFSLI